MIRRTATFLAGAAVALLLAGCVGPESSVGAPGAAPVGHGEMRFLGGWTGESDASGDGVVRMDVDAAAHDGTTFDGDLTFTIAGIATTARVAATMTPHGHLVADIGGRASIEAHITDPSTLDYCFVHYGSDPVYTCGRLTREAPDAGS